MTVTEAIERSNKVLIIGHQRPDGDCLGSGLAFLHICEKLNKSVDFLCDSDNPQAYSFMRGYDRLNDKRFSDYDLLICVDCADNFRLGRYIGYLKSVPVTFNIDHNRTNNYFAANNVVLPNASSTCEIVYDLIKDSGYIDEIVASSLFTGLSTDTGHFMHSNSSEHAFQVAAALVGLGANAYEISSSLYKSTTIERTKLTARSIESMRFFKDNKICIISIMSDDLEQTGCSIADTEGQIDYAMKIACVQVAICLTQQSKTQYKVSFRSKSVDVAAAAATFGGGGHTLAAGCVVSGKYEDVIDKLLKSVTDGMVE